MKFKNWCLALLCIVAQQSYSQEGVAVYTDYLNDNYYLIHPSMAGASNCTKIRATARQQWFDHPKAPALQTLSANGQIGENSGAGVVFYNDRNGNTSQTGGKVSYAQHIRLGNDYSTLNRLQLGISAGFVQSRLDERGFDLSTTQNRDFDYVVGGILQKDNYFNFDVGASYLLRSFYMHFTVRNLSNSKRELYSDVESPNIKKMLFNVGYAFGSTDIVQLEPSFMFINTLETKEKSIDLNLKATRKMDFGTVWLGLSYRRQLESAEMIDQNSAQRLSDLTPILGLTYKNFMFAYNYSQSLANINYGGGFHQFTLGMDILCKPTPYDCNCPAINNVN